ncbi:MAG: short-chain dehydrogenase [Deltaproteobacteria bacterium]|jgi:3-oxoacyl-[acyl-carrier protein] reductase|nr:short-chain dehydrogenase [Deltaproteobacteria bacterium]
MTTHDTPESRSDDRKTIIVTGATGGVGRGIAIACGRVGWSVWIAARREKEGLAVAEEVTAAGGTGHFVRCDAGERRSVEAMIDAVIEADGRLDGICHNATSGLSPVPVTLCDVPLKDFQNHVDVALRAAWALARKGHAALKESGGSLLLLTSEAGFEGKAKLSPYAGVKGAQRGFARALAREWGHDGIRVNSLAPLAATPAMERAFELDPEMVPRVLERNPLGYLGDPADDIGSAARFLLSDEARYVTGHTLMVDGGSCPAI